MSRFPYKRTVVDGYSYINPDATILVNLTGTSTAATIYVSEAGAVISNSTVTSSSDGSYEFWVDEADYSATQFFRTVTSKTGFATKTVDDIVIFPATSADAAATAAAASAAAAAASANAVADEYVFSDTITMADPTTGKFRLNNATVGSVTAIAVDDTTNATGNPDISSYLTSIDDGTNTTHLAYLTIRHNVTLATYALYSVTGLTDNSGWVEYAVTHVASTGTWTDADVAHISFARSGDKGTAGVNGAGSFDFFTTADPTANSDASNTDGNGVFVLGSHWTNTTSDVTFHCVDSTATSAIWDAVSVGAISNLSEDTTPQVGGTAGLDMQGQDILSGGVVFLTEQAEAEGDIAGDGQIWVNTATPNELWFTDDVGTDMQVGPDTRGKHTIWVPVQAMRPTTSNGCSALTDFETTAGRPDIQVMYFDGAADEHAQFGVGLPKGWNEGTVTFRAFSAVTDPAATDGTDTVSWGVQALGVADDASIDQAYGTGVVVTEATSGAVEDIAISAESGAITIAAAAVDTLTFFRVYRDVSADDMAEDAGLIGIQIFITTDAGEDT
jgi:hypothetical protein